MARHFSLVSDKGVSGSGDSGKGGSHAPLSWSMGPRSGAGGKPPLPVRTILIVEDNAFNLKLLDDLLRAAGYNTLKATDGRQALRAARRFRPDVILMDIGLPDISGIDVTREIRASDELKNTPVIAVTAYAAPEDEAAIRRAGCDDYITKPISAPVFLRMVRRHASFRLIDGGEDGAKLDRSRP
jgi:two-component system cell cycle response regulator DivK